MSGELTIRPAHSEDAAAILAYLRQIGAESDNLTFGPEGLPITEEQERQYLRQVENDPDARGGRDRGAVRAFEATAAAHEPSRAD